jgi:hypothetical protein
MDEDGDDEDEARADDEDPECHVVQDRTVIERGDNSSGVFREHKGKCKFSDIHIRPCLLRCPRSNWDSRCHWERR